MDAGVNLAHFEIIARIGVGGMGEVYRARDTKLDRDVDLSIRLGRGPIPQKPALEMVDLLDLDNWR